MQPYVRYLLWTSVAALAALSPTLESRAAEKSCAQLEADLKQLDGLTICGRISLPWYTMGDDKALEQLFKRAKTIAVATELADSTSAQWVSQCSPTPAAKRKYAGCFDAKAALTKRTKRELPSYFHGKSVQRVRVESVQRVRQGKPARGGFEGKRVDAYIKFALMYAKDHPWLGFDLKEHEALRAEVDEIYANAKATSDKAMAGVRCPKSVNAGLSKKLFKSAKGHMASLNKDLKTRTRELKKFSVTGPKRRVPKLTGVDEFLPVATCNKVTLKKDKSVYCEVVKGTWIRQKPRGGRWGKWRHYSVAGATPMLCKNLK